MTKQERVVEIAREVATIFGSGWQESHQVGETHIYSICIKGPEGQVILFSSSNFHAGKICISGQYPTYSNGRQWSSKESSEIFVSFDKTSAKIANDIKRRFFPKYLELLAQAQIDTAAERKYQSDKGSTAERIASLIDGTVQKSKTSDEVYVSIRESRIHSEATYGRITPRDNSVEFNQFTVTTDEACAMLQALIDFRTAKGNV